jgi:RND family efflux transporter MFP subunit
MNHLFARLLALLTLVILIGCGHRGKPSPPPHPPDVNVSLPIWKGGSAGPANFLVQCSAAECLAPAGTLLGPLLPQVAAASVVTADALALGIAEFEDLTGRLNAVSTVEIRARVTGYLKEVKFKDGDIVTQNQDLYLIDPRPFEAALARARGEVERLEGEKKLLDIQVERYTRLVEKGAASKQELDQYIAKKAENIGALKAAEAQVEIARLNLEFTRITAPITGKINRTFITPGNLVVADTTQLTTIVSIDPMYVYFNLEEPRLIAITKMLRSGVVPEGNIGNIRIPVWLSDDPDRKEPLVAQLDFSSNVVDPTTGTITVRGVLPNPYHMPGKPPLLKAGMFVRVRLPLGRPQDVLLVAEPVIGTDQGQKYVYVVDKDNKVVYRQVQLGLLIDGLRVVKGELHANDRVLVSGLQRVRPNQEVKPELIDMHKLLPERPGSAGGRP